MNGWASILSTIAGAAMLLSKSNADNGNGNGGGKKNTSTQTDTTDKQTTSPSESAYEEYKRMVDEANAQQKITDPRNSNMYFGNPNAPYDPFYDYKDDPIYNTRDSVDYPSHGNVDVVKACRARIVSPYVLSEEVLKNAESEDDLGVIGCKNSYMGIFSAAGKQYYRRYTFEKFMNGYQTTEVDGQNQRTVKLARGNFRYITFYLEILNPSKNEAEIQMCGIESVSIANEKCQPIHLGSFPREYMMGQNEVNGRLYMYSGADKIEAYGNEGFFSARELRAEQPIKSNGSSVSAKWLEMGYPYVMCDNIANNGYQYQDWKDIYEGKRRTGWATEEGKKEVEVIEGNAQRGDQFIDYEHNYLKINPHSSRIVKITLPLASLNDTSVRYIPEGKLYDWDYRKGKIEKIHSFSGMADSEVATSKYKSMTKNQFEEIANSYYTTMHNMMVGGYCLISSLLLRSLTR